MVPNPSNKIHAFFLPRIRPPFCPSKSCLSHPQFHRQAQTWGRQALDSREYAVHVPWMGRIARQSLVVIQQ